MKKTKKVRKCPKWDGLDMRGQRCPYTDVFCQEYLCENCCLYPYRRENKKWKK